MSGAMPLLPAYAFIRKQGQLYLEIYFNVVVFYVVRSAYEVFENFGGREWGTDTIAILQGVPFFPSFLKSISVL